MRNSHPTDDLFNSDSPPTLEKYGLGRIAAMTIVYGPEKAYPGVLFPEVMDHGRLVVLNINGFPHTAAATVYVQDAWRLISPPSRPGNSSVTTTEYFETSVSKLESTRNMLSATVSASTGNAWGKVSVSVTTELERTRQMQKTSVNGTSTSITTQVKSNATVALWEKIQFVTVEFDKQELKGYLRIYSKKIPLTMVLNTNITESILVKVFADQQVE